jgi:hypothetical protein
VGACSNAYGVSFNDAVPTSTRRAGLTELVPLDNVLARQFAGDRAVQPPVLRSERVVPIDANVHEVIGAFVDPIPPGHPSRRTASPPCPGRPPESDSAMNQPNSRNDRPSTGRICAYCGEPVLTGAERPEHPLPRALGSSLMVFTACDPCNAWAGREVDQPFLDDDWLLIHRADHDVRDPRHPGRPIRHPLRRGFTEDYGERMEVRVDEGWKPHLGGRIIDKGNDEIQIVAGSQEQAEKLLRRVERDAAAEGKTVEMGEWEHSKGRPWININTRVNLGAWMRMAAKIALGVGSHIYDEGWRTSADAVELRRLMRECGLRSDDGGPLGLFPMKLAKDDVLRRIADPPEHLIWFTRSSNGTTGIGVLLFGELIFGMPVDTAGRKLPPVAWALDPRRPDDDGETTWETVLLRAVRRVDSP